MALCRGWRGRVAFSLGLYAFYLASALFILGGLGGAPGTLESVFYNVALSISLGALTAGTSLFLLYYSRSTLFSLSAPGALGVLAFLSPGLTLLLLPALTVSFLALAVVSLALQLYGGIGDSALEGGGPPERWSPIALSTAALSTYLAGLTLPGEMVAGPPGYVYSASCMVAAIIASARPPTPLKGALLGLMAGLGPIGLALVASYASFRPLHFNGCRGVEVGVLVGASARCSPSRSAVSVRTLRLKANTIACVYEQKAVLSLSEPWVVWVYSGAPADRLLRELAGEGSLHIKFSQLKAGGRPVEEELARARLGGVGEVELQAPANYKMAVEEVRYVLKGAEGINRVIVDFTQVDFLEEQSVKAAVFEASRHVSGVYAVIPLIPWSSPQIAPKGPASSSGFIAYRLRDPAQIEQLARALGLPSSQLREVFREGASIAYPGCGSRILVVAFSPVS